MPNAFDNPVATAAGASKKGLWQIIITISTLIISKWRWSLTIFFGIILLMSSVVQSIHEQSIRPLVFEFGGRLVSSDEVLYQHTKALEKNNFVIPADIDSGSSDIFNGFKVFWAKAVFIFNMVGTIWFIYLTIFMWYKIVRIHNSAEMLYNSIFAIIIVMLLQIAFSNALLHINAVGNCNITEEQAWNDVGMASVPMKGCALFIIDSPQILHLEVEPFNYSEAK